MSCAQGWLAEAVREAGAGARGTLGPAAGAPHGGEFMKLVASGHPGDQTALSPEPAAACNCRARAPTQPSPEVAHKSPPCTVEVLQIPRNCFGIKISPILNRRRIRAAAAAAAAVACPWLLLHLVDLCL